MIDVHSSRPRMNSDREKMGIKIRTLELNKTAVAAMKGPLGRLTSGT